MRNRRIWAARGAVALFVLGLLAYGAVSFKSTDGLLRPYDPQKIVAAVDFVQRKAGVDRKRVAIIGGSMGEVARDHPERAWLFTVRFDGDAGGG